MAKATQFCIAVENKPGVLAKLCAVLTRARVNIEAISVVDSADCCLVRLVASPAARAKAALTRGKYHFCGQRVLMVQAENKPGALGKIAAKLAKARVNIHYVYASAGDGKRTRLVMGVSDLNRAAKTVG